MLNCNLLKALLTERGETAQDYANVIGTGITTAYARLNGISEHTREEMNAVKEHYKLTNERFLEIFFA